MIVNPPANVIAEARRLGQPAFCTLTLCLVETFKLLQHDSRRVTVSHNVMSGQHQQMIVIFEPGNLNPHQRRFGQIEDLMGLLIDPFGLATAALGWC